MVKYLLVVAALCLLAGSLAAGSPAYAKDRSSRSVAACANPFCTKLKPSAPSCRRFDRRKVQSKCFIKRAAAHFGQSTSLAMSIAHRESRFDPKATNSSSGAAGIYQFMPTTWAHTPYRKHSPYNPRWAALGAMWMWAHGGYGHWSL